MQPFRFGLATFNNRWYTPTKDNWIQAINHIEELGFSSIFIPDHFEPQWEPVATLAAVAAVTKDLKVGTSVFDVDYRHPVVLAQSSATIHTISNGRHEFGIGAGWLKDEYLKTGIQFDPAWKRIQRLEEAVKIIKSLWINESTTFHGKNYNIENLGRVSPPLVGRPRLMIGGGGKIMLKLAGRQADIVNISASIPKGVYDRDAIVASGESRLGEKLNWIHGAAIQSGRGVDDIELSIWAPRIKITDDADSLYKNFADRFKASIDEIRDWTYLLYGTGEEIREKLKRWNENFGISYIVTAGESMADIEAFSEEIIRPLT